MIVISKIEIVKDIFCIYFAFCFFSRIEDFREPAKISIAQLLTRRGLNQRYLVPIRRETRAGLHDIRNWHLPLVDETPHELGGAGNGFQEIQVDVPQLQRAGLVVGGRDNQGFPVILGEVEGQLDALIELERLGDYARDVTVGRHPVDGVALDHEEEPVRILAQDFDRLSGHLGQGG